MALAEVMPRLNRFIGLLVICILAYFIIPHTTITSSLFAKKPLDACSTANHQWRGANDKIYVRSGAPVEIIHKDWSDGLVNHKVSVLFARAPSEDFSIQTDVFTSHDIPADNFEISYAHDQYIINSMVPKGASLLLDEETSGSQHCVVIKIYISVPVSKPLTGLKFVLPHADVLVHESTAGALPYLDIQLGQGSVVMSAGQRLHTEQTRIQIEQGSVEGKFMLTKSLTLFLQRGTIDIDVGYSPFLVGASIDITQQTGLQRVSIEDLFYRGTSGSYQMLGEGTIELDYPKSYAGLINLLANEGIVNLHGHGLDILRETGKGVLPVDIQARQGGGPALTTVYNVHGKIKMNVADPGKQRKTIEMDE